MINVHYLKDLSRYILPVDNFITDDLDIKFKFDTGADHSVINVSSLFPSIDLAERAVLYVKELIEKEACISESFMSASGNPTSGILCYVSDFRLKGDEGSLAFDFYFYLITSTAYKKALLGVDFISCCDFSCEAGKDINVERFHDSRYSGALGFREKSKAINVNDLLKEIQTPAIATRHKIVKEHFGTKTLAEFIKKVNEANSLDSLELEAKLDSMDSSESHNSGDSELKSLNFV